MVREAGGILELERVVSCGSGELLKNLIAQIAQSAAQQRPKRPQNAGRCRFAALILREDRLDGSLGKRYNGFRS
jgi:hypothetical protein